MKKLFLFVIFVLFNINCYSQITFEDGYFVKESGERVDCLIKNLDWKNNPTEFKYKLSKDSEIKTANIKTVKEFGITNTSKYQRFTVDIDRSSSDLDNISTQMRAQFNREQLFLQVLVGGQATLYHYEDGNLQRYFFNIDDGNINQLVYKKYRSFDGQTGENNLFRQQLLNNVNCKDISTKTIQTIDYKKNDLVSYFVDYNNCNNVAFTNFRDKQKRDLFNLTIRPGLKSAALSIHNNRAQDKDFGTQISFRFGVEAEFILPYNKNKWGVFVEPTYQYFKGEAPNRLRTVKVDYQSIELPLGIRHYFYLNQNSKLFLDGSIVIDLDGNSKVEYNPTSSLDINTRENLVFGIGYNHNDKYSAEFRYGTNREFLSDYTYWSSDYQSLSLILGYNLF